MTSFEHFELSRDDADIAWLTIDVEGRSANILSQQVMEELIKAVDESCRRSAGRIRVQVWQDSGGSSSARTSTNSHCSKRGPRWVAYLRGVGMFP